MFFCRKPTYHHTLLTCYLSYITQAVVCNLAPLFFVIFNTHYHLTYEQLGGLTLVNFGVQILTDLIAARYIDTVGYRVCGIAAHIAAAAGLCMMGLLPLFVPRGAIYPALVGAAVVYAVGGGLVEIICNPVVDSLPGKERASAISLLHSFYCWGQVAVVSLSTLALRFAGDRFWFAIPLVWAALPVMNAVNFTRVPIPQVPHEEGSGRAVFGRLLGSKIILIALLLMLSGGAAEQVMAQWASMFAEAGLRLPKLLGDLLGPCLFAVMMGVVRTVYGIAGSRFPLRRALTVSALFCVVCYLVASLSRNPYISLAACAATGLAVALMWPGTVALIAGLYPSGGGAMFGVLSLAGDVGCSLGPWLTGMVSGAVEVSSSGSGLTGIQAGIFVSLIFPALMLLGLFLLRRTTAAGDADRKTSDVKED